MVKIKVSFGGVGVKRFFLDAVARTIKILRYRMTECEGATSEKFDVSTNFLINFDA